MVQHLVNVLVAFLELLEAEAERFTAGARKLLVTGAVVAVAAVVASAMLLAASGLLLWAFYLALLTLMTEPWAALSVGLAVWFVVGVGTWLAVARMGKS